MTIFNTVNWEMLHGQDHFVWVTFHKFPLCGKAHKFWGK
jgi:hypothetical protein